MKRLFSLFFDSRQALPCRIDCREMRRLFDNNLFYIAGQDDLLWKEYFQTNFILWGNIDRFISIPSLMNRSFRSGSEAISAYIRQNKQNISSGMNPTLCSCPGIRLGKADRTMLNNRIIRTSCYTSSPKLFLRRLGILPFDLHLSQQKPHIIQNLSEFQRSINCEQSNLRNRSSLELSLSPWKGRPHNVRKRLYRRRSRIYASFGQL